MSPRGRHTSARSGSFYRQLLTMVLGILLVGVVVFGGILFYLNGGFGGATTTTTTTQAVETIPTVAPTVATTTIPTTTLPPTTTTVPPDTTVPEGPEVRDPPEVSVVVLNGAGVAGIAGEVSEELAIIGYDMAEPNNFGDTIENSRIVYAPGFNAEASRLQAEFPGAEMVEDAELTEEWEVDVVVVVGTSHAE